MKIIKLTILFLICALVENSFASNRIVNLDVGYKNVNFAGKIRRAIAVNNQIPAPTLHFREGDHVTINVTNHLDKETAIHWHGILVPWQMDGVLGVSQHGIQPNKTFKYQFTVHQSGSYWYHAHAGLQEQQGLYGAFLIDPLKKETYQYNDDDVVVLSDWSNTNPEQILSNLKKNGDYYSPDFPLQPSLMKFINDYYNSSSSEKVKLIDDYKMMQQMRMSIYDLSDVAYNAFLLNGHPNSYPWTAVVRVGDKVRLRFIGAAGSTIFHVKIPDAMMKIVQVDGNDVRPLDADHFSIAPGETYDVLVKIEKNRPYIIYAESNDTLGAAYGALITAPTQQVDYKNVVPFATPKPVTREMMSLMMGKMTHGSQKMNVQSHPGHEMGGMADGHEGHGAMGHDMPMSMEMPTEPSIIGDKFSPPTTSYSTSINTKYKDIIAAVKTNNPNKPVAKVINMELFGYMGRYIWFVNGEPEYKAKPIILEPGKRYRFVFTNTSMMHHPMHIHGHWFIFRKGNGSYDPLLHTIDVAPGATITADLDTDASGQWLFHCHMQYHMMSGMSRVFQYSTLIELTKNEMQPQDVIEKTPYHNRPIVRVDSVRPIDTSMVHHPMPHYMGMWLATFLDVGADPFNNAQRLTYNGLYGYDYNKLELFINDAEMSKNVVENADIDVFYWHLIDQFWAIKGGVNYFYRPASSPYWQPGIGLEGLMPYFIDTDIRAYYYAGSAKLDMELSRDTQITNNFFIRLGVRSILGSNTDAAARIGSGLNQMRYIVRPYYRLMPGLNVVAEFEHEGAYGNFAKLQRNAGESVGENTLTFGVSMLF